MDQGYPSNELEMIASIGKVNIKQLVQMLIKTFTDKLDSAQQDIYQYTILRQHHRQLDRQLKNFQKKRRFTSQEAASRLTAQITKAVDSIMKYQTSINEYDLDVKFDFAEDTAPVQPIPVQVMYQPPPPPPAPAAAQTIDVKKEGENEQGKEKEKGTHHQRHEEPISNEFYKPENLSHIDVRVAKQMCGVCMIKFRTGIELSAHIVNYHGLDLNNKAAPIRKMYPNYAKINQDLLKYTCFQCQEVIVGPFWKYRFHLNQVHNIRDWFTCVDCQSQYDDVIELSKHIFKAHKVRLHNCRDFYRCKATRRDFFHHREIQKHLVETMAYHRQVPDGYEEYIIKTK